MPSSTVSPTTFSSPPSLTSHQPLVPSAPPSLDFVGSPSEVASASNPSHPSLPGSSQDQEDSGLLYADPVSRPDLQWAINHPEDRGSASSRGNRPVAELCNRPIAAFSQGGFLTLGAIRAFPNKQMRAIACALHERALPLSHPIVRAVLAQATFHVGELHGDGGFVWRRDMVGDGCGDVRRVLLDELEHCAGILEPSPRSHGDIVALCGLVAFLSQGGDDVACRLSCRYARIAAGWAHDLRNEVAEGDSSGRSPELLLAMRAKECLMNGYGLMKISITDTFKGPDRF